MAHLQLYVDGGDPEAVEAALFASGALSVSLLDAADDPVLEPAPGETPLWPRTTVVGLFASDADPLGLELRVRASLPGGEHLRVRAERLAEREWVRAWLEHWQPLRFGRRLWVTPAEKRPAITDPAAEVLVLDPGLAFGTGTHPTTALCLEWLDGLDLTGATVLDYGCGSGILAIAALRLGAARAWAVDIDPQALLATRENACANGVAERLTVMAPETLPAPEVDVVLANILAGPLVALAPRLIAALKPGGRLALAGLLSRQAGEVRAAYAGAIAFDAPASREDWVRLTGRKR